MQDEKKTKKQLLAELTALRLLMVARENPGEGSAGEQADTAACGKPETERDPFYKFFQTTADIMVIADPNGVFMQVNPACTEILGYSEAELLAKPYLDFVHPEDRQSTLMEVSSQLKKGYSLNFVNRYLCKDGSVKLLSWRASYSPAEGTSYAIARDITGHKMTYDLLQQSEERFRAVFDRAAIGIARVAPDGRFIEVNREFCKFFGLTKEELLSRSFQALTYPEDLETDVCNVRRLLLGEIDHFTREKRYIHKSGALIWGHVSVSLIRDGQGVPQYNIAVLKDISQRKRWELLLRRSEENLNRAQAVARIGSWILNVADNRLEWSAETYRMFGIPPQEPVDFEKFLSRVHPDDCGLMLPAWEAALRGEAFDLEYRIVVSGQTLWVRARVQVERDSQGQPQYGVGTVQDITELKLARDRITQLAAERGAILDTLPIGVFFIKDRKVVWCNAVQQRILGYAAGEIIGLETKRVFADTEGYERVGAEGYAQLAKGGAYAVTMQMKRRDGTVFWSNLAGRALDPENLAEGSIWILEDITERKLAEQELRDTSVELKKLSEHLEQRVRDEVESRRKSEELLLQQARMAAMGEMIGAIAHQWKQPLNALGLIVQNIGMEYEYGTLDETFIRETVAKSMTQIRHMSKTIDDFRNFFKPNKEKTTFDAMGAVTEIVRLVGEQLRSRGIDCRLTCHAHDRTFSAFGVEMCCTSNTITGYRNEFEHVILNLISNARDAIAEQNTCGSPDARTGGCIDFDFHCRDSLLRLEVSDSGGGIKPDILRHMFTPYFTTKDEAGGTGLGLYMSKVILGNMGGTIVVSNGSRGALFTLELPRTV